MATSKGVVKNLSYNQHEILYQIMQMHNGGRPYDCDMTYSKGNFYGTFTATDDYGNKYDFEIPQPKYKFDVYPQVEGCEKIEPLGNLPLEDSSIDSIVIDLPFVVSCGPSMQNHKDNSNIISDRFSAYYPISELYRSYFHWISEASRVLKDDGICVFKLQPTISGSINHQIDAFSVVAAQECGMETEDMWILLSKQRLISGKVKNQQHARKYHSNFFVFKKAKSKKYDKFNYLTMIKNLKEDINCEDIYK